MGRLEGKVALISGGARGQGADEARLFAAEGAEVVLTDVLDDEGEQVAAEVGGAYLHHDVTSEDEWAAAVARTVELYGGLDVLINNAGIYVATPLIGGNLDDYRRVIEVNQVGVFLGMREAAPAMIERGGGSIVNISSIAAWETSTDHGAAYSAAKAGVLALTRVAAAENGRHGVRVNAVAPGLIYNDFLRRIYPEEFFENYAEARSLLGRVGRPDDVAELVSFLASERAAYITGEVFGISGGVAPRG